jgi:hypothetical protein
LIGQRFTGQTTLQVAGNFGQRPVLISNQPGDLQQVQGVTIEEGA